MKFSAYQKFLYFCCGEARCAHLLSPWVPITGPRRRYARRSIGEFVKIRTPCQLLLKR